MASNEVKYSDNRIIKRKYILLGRKDLWWGELVTWSWAEATAPDCWKKNQQNTHTIIKATYKIRIKQGYSLNYRSTIGNYRYSTFMTRRNENSTQST